MFTSTILRRLACFELALFMSAGAAALGADTDPLPIDSAVTVKRLTNGLTYYIRQNKKPENRAQFHLAINAGSLLETDKQQGLAHFLEHMAFNGTRNFKKMELVNFLERIGMRFGADLNAYTSFDETAYRLEIPMDKPEFLAKAFQVLEDWAHQIEFDADEIEKERGVVLEEWRTGRGAAGRIRDKQIPVLFHNSRYAERLPIGTTNAIQSVSREDFLDFYRKWYRPDLMAVVAVGDFDPKAIEDLIIQHFSKLKNPANSPPRAVPAVPDHAGTLFSIETDPELSTTSIEVVCKHPVQPEDTAGDYRRKLVEMLYSTLINQRLGEKALDANPPYRSAAMFKSRMVRVKEVAAQRAAVKEGLYAEGLRALLVEAKRVRRDGFSTVELNRAKADVLRYYEQAYAEREKSESADFAREYIDHFLEGEPIPGITEELRLVKQFFQGISVEEVNRVGASWMNDSNRVILFTAPAKPGVKVPSREDILSVIKEADSADVAAYVDSASSAPLVPQLPPPGKIVAETFHAGVDVIEWTLANGIHVLLKPTAFKNDEILMSAMSPGGHSLVADQDYISASMGASLLRQGGLGAYDAIQLRKRLAGKIAGVNASVGELHETLAGQASPQDLETWFQLMHLHFTAPRIDDKTFQSFIARAKAGIENRERNPQAVFGDAIEKTVYGNHPRHRPMSLELLKELDRESALRIYRDRFANAGDFTFGFVGAFKTNDLRPWIEAYLGSLPSFNRPERGRHVGDDPKRGQLTVEVKKGIEPKSAVRIDFRGEAVWSVEERFALRSAVDVLRIRLREVLREDKGGVYGVGVSGDLQRLPKPTYSTGISFSCSPAMVDELIAASMREVAALQSEGPSADNLEKVREAHLRNFEKGLKEDGFWLASLMFYRENELPLDIMLKLPERVKALTGEKVREAARKYFSTQDMLTARLLPEDSAAPNVQP